MVEGQRRLCSHKGALPKPRVGGNKASIQIRYRGASAIFMALSSGFDSPSLQHDTACCIAIKLCQKLSLSCIGVTRSAQYARAGSAADLCPRLADCPRNG